MFKFVSIVAWLAIASQVLAEQDTTTSSALQNLFKKIQDASSNVDFAKLSAGAVKAQETLGPVLTQLKQASQPVVGDLQKKLADSGLVPTTTANPVGGVLKHLQLIGIGSDIDVAKVQENTKKAQDTFGPLFSQFSSLINKKSSGEASKPAAAAKSPIDDYIIADPTTAAPTTAAPATTTAAPAKTSDVQSALKTLQDVGSKIDINQVKDGAKKVQSFFSQFGNKNSAPATS